MQAKYGDEESNLKISTVLFPFLKGNLKNFGKRIMYNYFLRNVSMASFELLFGLLLTGFGLITGLGDWSESIESGIPATGGTVMLAALPIIIGFQLLLAFLSADIASVYKTPLSNRLGLRDLC